MSLYPIESPQPLRLADGLLWLHDQAYRPVRELGRGKSAISFLYQPVTASAGSPAALVLKRYRSTADETIPFAQTLAFELTSYQRLQQAGVRHPTLLGFSPTDYCLAKEYIEGEVIIDILEREGLDDRHFRAALAMAAQLQQAGFHVDYYPANFVLNPDGLYYIDYEAHPYQAEWDFANWGIFYWLNQEGIRQFRATGDPRHINKPGQPKPWDEPFMRQRESLLRRLMP